MICKHKSTKLSSSKYCYVSLTIQLNLAQLAGAVKYTDCISTEGQDPPPMSVLIMTVNNLRVRL